MNKAYSPLRLMIVATDDDTSPAAGQDGTLRHSCFRQHSAREAQGGFLQTITLDAPIGLISDTHGLLRPEALTLLEGCRLILHLGDVGARDEDSAILERLGELAPVLAVRGNVDTAPWAEVLPETLDLEVNGWRLHLVHILAEFDPATSCDAVLHGHSHKPRHDWQAGRLLFNPGAAGKRRFRLPITLGKLWVDDRGMRTAILHLPL